MGRPSESTSPNASDRAVPPCGSRSSLADETLSRRFDGVADDLRYRHFVRIPQRILRCLDYFQVECDRTAVARRLRAYYLFIGVLDDAIDSGELEAGRIALQRFTSKHSRVQDSTNLSDVNVMIEVLKREACDETYPQMLSVLHQLNTEVIRERTAISMAAYIEARKSVGRLTAKSSYLMIRPLLIGGTDPVRLFMERVGEIGCLVDSVIDLNADRRIGLLNFQPTPLNFVHLTRAALGASAGLSLKHPRLLGAFLQALADDVMDRFLSRRGDTVPRSALPRKGPNDSLIETNPDNDSVSFTAVEVE